MRLCSRLVAIQASRSGVIYVHCFEFTIMTVFSINVKAVLFNRLVQRVFINRGEQFEAAISRVRETTLDASTKYCHGKIQL